MKSKLLIALVTLSQVVIAQNNSKNNEVVFDQNCVATSLNRNVGSIVMINSDASIPDNLPSSIINVRALTELNATGQADAYPWISGDGLRLYYTNGTGSDNNRIMYTSRPNTSSLFSAPVELIPANQITNCYLTIDELTMYIGTSTLGLLVYQRSSLQSSFGSPTSIALTGINTTGNITGCSLDNSQNSLFLRINSTAGTHNFIRTSPTSFAYSYSMPDSQNFYGPGQLAKDDLNYVFGLKQSANGVSKIAKITRPNVNTNFAQTTDNFSYIDGLNDNVLTNIQPTSSTNMQWFVFVRNSSGLWSDNNLYIAESTVLSANDYNNLANQIEVYPNPSNGVLYVDYGSEIIESDFNVELFNNLGQKVASEKLKSKLDYSSFPKGVYFLKFYNNSFSMTKKIIIK